MQQGSTNIIDMEVLQRYVDESETLHEALGVPAGTHLELTPFAQGEYNANYAFDTPTQDGVQHCLLRVNLGSQMHLEHQIDYEFHALRVLEPSGRVPKALFVDGSRTVVPFGVGVEERLPGRPLRYEDDLEEAAAIFADIHAVDVPTDCRLIRPAHPVESIVDECERMFSVYRSWAQAEHDVLRRIDAMFVRARAIAERDRSRTSAEELHVVNTEVNSSNFLINPGATSYLIDWEKPVLGEAEQDLAHFLVPTTTYWKTDTRFVRANVDGFVDTYEQAVAGRFSTEGLRERLDDYLVVTCLRGLTWCAMALTEYVSGGRAAANADTFAKIQEYLQDEFLTLVEQEYYKD